MQTTQRQRDAYTTARNDGRDLDEAYAALGLIHGSILLTRDAATGGFLFMLPGGREFMRVDDLMHRLSTAEDNGRAELLKLWPGCPSDWADKILAAVNVAPMILGGGA